MKKAKAISPFFWKEKVKASSLAYALVILLLVAFALAAIIGIQFLNNKVKIRLSDQKELLDNVHSGLNYYLAAQIKDDKWTHDLFGREKDSVHIDKTFWGLYPVLHIASARNGQEGLATVMTGVQASSQVKHSLYLSDKNTPLSVCGKTKITGNVMLPEAGVKRAYIEGQTYQGDRLIYGQVLQSDSKLPLIATEVSQRMQEVREIGEEWIQYDPEDLDSIYVPFSEAEQVIYSRGPIHLSLVSIRGAVKIMSEVRIVIQSDAHLDRVCIVAPEIEVQSGFRGNIQCFASHILHLEKGVEFLQPSVIVLDANHQGNHHIHVEDEAHVQGLILDISNPMYNSEIRLDRVEIEGFVYGTNQVQISGELKGGLYADKIRLRTSSANYGNHLLNVTLDRSALDQDFILPPLFDADEQKILTWLD